MAVYVNNFILNIGTDFIESCTLYTNIGKPIDLTDYTANATLRKHSGSSKSFNFEVSFTNRKEGEINLFIPSNITSTLKSGRYVYDILLTSPTEYKTIVLEGSILARPGITNNIWNS